MRRLAERHFGATVFIFLLVAIGFGAFEYLLQDENSRARPEMGELLVGDDPKYQPPCWNDIFPGVTTITDGLLTLESIPWVRTDTISHYPRSNLYSFRLFPNGIGSLYYNNGIVTSIELAATDELVLNEAIELLGEPRWITLIIDSGELAYTAHLVFPDDKVVLEAFSMYEVDAEYQSDNSYEATIYPEMRIEVAWFYAAPFDSDAETILSERLGQPLWRRGRQEPIVQEWSGYGTYLGVP
jgi:hypothetical protein